MQNELTRKPAIVLCSNFFFIWAQISYLPMSWLEQAPSTCSAADKPVADGKFRVRTERDHKYKELWFTWHVLPAFSTSIPRHEFKQNYTLWRVFLPLWFSSLCFLMKKKCFWVFIIITRTSRRALCELEEAREIRLYNFSVSLSETGNRVSGLCLLFMEGELELGML